MSEINLKKSELQKSFKIKVPYSLMQKNMEIEFENLSKSLKIPGFRPGKVPFLLLKINILKKSSIKHVKGLYKRKEIRTFKKKSTD